MFVSIGLSFHDLQLKENVPKERENWLENHRLSELVYKRSAGFAQQVISVRAQTNAKQDLESHGVTINLRWLETPIV